MALAFSGGIDSSASAIILCEIGLKPNAVMVDLGYRFHNPKETANSEEWCKNRGLELLKISMTEEIGDLLDRVDKGRVHPCGECHMMIMESVRNHVTENNYPVLITGELLPSGRQSVILENDVLVIHLPAALSLSKHRTESIAVKSGMKIGRRKFGCNMVSKSHMMGWRYMGPSIFRVLRELEAGILTTGQALDYIKDIIPHSLRKSKDMT